jgi:hypothetical protein
MRLGIQPRRVVFVAAAAGRVSKANCSVRRKVVPDQPRQDKCCKRTESKSTGANNEETCDARMPKGIPKPPPCELGKLGRKQHILHSPLRVGVSPHLTYQDWTVGEVLTRFLPMSETPSSYETIGSIARVNLRQDVLPIKYIVGPRQEFAANKNRRQ